MIGLLITFIIVLIIVISLFIGVFSVPYVPTPRYISETILKESFIHDGLNVYELGSGTGGFLAHIANRYSIKGTGYEIAPLYFIISFIRSLFFRKSKINYKMETYFNANLKDADIVYCYLLPKTLNKLKNVFDSMKKGSIIISLDFKIPLMNVSDTIISRNKKIYIYRIS